jgi:hypothetical protein
MSVSPVKTYSHGYAGHGLAVYGGGFERPSALDVLLITGYR